MLLPYRVKIWDTKVTHFTPILPLCACLYRSHLRKPVSIKQTKHSRKSEAQNLCSKFPTFMRTHAFKRLRHCAIAAAMMVWSSSFHSLVVVTCSSWSATSWLSHSRIRFVNLLDQVVYTTASLVFARKFVNKFTGAVTFSFRQNFNKMFIFVGEWHDFSDVSIMSPGKGCTWHAMW